MPLQATSGVATYDAFGGGAATAANYIEDVFSTWLYTGNGSARTINNGIDLAGKGGLVWIKARDGGAQWHRLFDTNRGSNFSLVSNDTTAQINDSNLLSSFGSSGFNLGSDGTGNVNSSGRLYASWTFRKQPKFFDVVTYTGNGANDRKIAHSLGSVPGCIMVKRTDTAGNWQVYHRSAAADPSIALLVLNTTAAVVTDGNVWWSTPPTSTEFTVGGVANVNASGGTYVAYVFAHNAGGFGLTGTDNVISCGSYTGNGSAQDINLGYEAQWVLVKNATTAGWDWYTVDNMRGFVVTPASPNFTKSLSPNTSGAESDLTAISPSSTGFRLNSSAGAFNTNGDTYIYIAIRRGPMKTPTTGTSVFDAEFEGNVPDGQKPFTRSSTGVVDMAFRSYRPGGVWNGSQVWSRLQDSNYFNGTASTAAETSGTAGSFAYNNGWFNSAATSTITAQVDWMFRRAPGFFDEVCYTGTGATNARTHNLTVAPELIIVKSRSAVDDWAAMTLFGASTFGNGYLNTTLALSSKSYASNVELTTQPTATTFTLGTGGPNASGSTYVAYLFASCPGVSKVGSYTGTGTTQVINCGFTAGARFVLIKRTDSTGDWYVWDSARGIVAGNDPYLLLNSTAAEVTSTDYVDTAATGFELSSTAPAAINASGGSFIFFAVA